MKRMIYLPIAILMLSGTFLNAQIEKKDSLSGNKSFYKNELGIDMVFFLNLFRNQYEVTNTTQLFINYDRWIAPKTAIRCVVGFGFNNNQVKQDTLPLLSGKTSNIIIKIGLRREQRISKRWLFYYGCDLAYENDLSSSQIGDYTSGVVTTTIRNVYYGPSPFMGVRFEINSRISFTTETNANLFFYNKENIKENDKFPVQNATTTTKGFGLEYIIPQNIYLKVKF